MTRSQSSAPDAIARTRAALARYLDHSLAMRALEGVHDLDLKSADPDDQVIELLEILGQQRGVIGMSARSALIATRLERARRIFEQIQFPMKL